MFLWLATRNKCWTADRLAQGLASQRSSRKDWHIKEVEFVTRQNFYDAEKTELLMEAKLPDACPLINVCECFSFVPDLIHYLYTNNMLQCIEGYVQKVNPGNYPLVIGQLLDDECPEDFIKEPSALLTQFT